MLLASLILVVTYAVTSSEAFVVISNGVCPDVPTQKDFDLNRYVGRWYSYEDFDVPYQMFLSCISATYSLKSNGKIRVLNSGFRNFKLFGMSLWKSPVEIEGEAYVVNNTRPGGLMVQFGQQPIPEDGKPNYKIVSTDYTTYSLVYSCTQPTPLPFRIDAAWVLTRDRGMRPTNLGMLELMLRNYGINTDNFKLVDHDDC